MYNYVFEAWTKSGIRLPDIHIREKCSEFACSAAAREASKLYPKKRLRLSTICPIDGKKYTYQSNG